MTNYALDKPNAKLLGVCAGSSCIVPVMAENETPPESVVALPDSVLGVELIAVANRVRESQGLPVLAQHHALDVAARDYALELAERGELSHVSQRLGFRTAMDRVHQAGASMQRVAENLAVVHDRATLTEQTVRLWLDSPSHRATLLNRAYTLTGTGVAQGTGRKWYAVQLYARPMPGS